MHLAGMWPGCEPDPQESEQDDAVMLVRWRRYQGRASVSESEYEEAAAPAEDEGDVVVRWNGEPGRRQTRGQAQMRCILLHGFNGEPVDMCEIEHHLSAHGFAITNMLLPGHGTSGRDFAVTRWEHWLDAVRSEARRSLARGEHVVLIGHSMGGALSPAMAASEPGIVG